MLNATFVRTVGDRDRIYVTRSNGTEVSWVFPTYGDTPPHDMVHLIVESAFGLRQGFWGRVDAGIDPGLIAQQANRMGGRDKYAAFGPDAASLLLAEILANAGWFGSTDATPVHRRITDICRESNVDPPSLLSLERTAQVADVLAHLAGRWSGLRPKGAIQLFFDPEKPERTFGPLLKLQT